MSHLSLLPLKTLIREERRPPFFNQIDLYSIEDGITIGVTGAMGQGFKLEGENLLLRSDQELEDFEHRARMLWNSLPERTVLHFIVRAQKGDEELLKEFAGSASLESGLSTKLIWEKLSFLKAHPFLRKEIFLFVILPPPGWVGRLRILPRLSLGFGGKARRLASAEFQMATSALTQRTEKIRGGLRSLGFSVMPLPDDELMAYLDQTLNPFYSSIGMRPHEAKPKTGALDSESLRSRLLLSPPIRDERFFYMDHYFHKAINLRELPSETTLKSMCDFEASLGDEYLLSMTVEVPDQAREKARLKREGNLARGEAFFSRTKDYEAEARSIETDSMLTELAQTEDKLFYVSMSVVIKSPDKAKIERRSEEVLRAFTELGGARAIDDHMNHDRLFLALLPLQGTENPLSFLVRSEVLTHLLPLQATWKGTKELGLLLRSDTNEPLRLDPFDPSLQAKHALMLGSTGSGKSFFTSFLITQFLIQSEDHEVIVIDVGGSYRKIAKILKASYLEVECSEAYALNPFPQKGILFPEAGGADTTFLQFLKELLQRMIEPNRAWRSSEKMILEEAIRASYEALKGDESPLLGDIEAQLRDFKTGDQTDKRLAYEFAKELRLFTTGEYGRILNQQGSFDFDSRFTVFDLRNLSQYPELQAILLFIIPFALKRKFENLAKKKILVLDECWRLLKEAQGTELVELFYRTARKMNAGVLSISQNPADFLESRIASVMINNSPVKYILKLKEGHEELAHLGLNPNELRRVRDLTVEPGRYSEVFIKFDARQVVARLMPSPLEYWLGTTEACDLLEEAKIIKRSPCLSDLDRLIELGEKFPNGAICKEDEIHAGS